MRWNPKMMSFRLSFFFFPPFLPVESIKEGWRWAKKKKWRKKSFLIFFILYILVYVYATKNKKIMRKTTSTKKIFNISQRLDDILLRYLTNWLCAPSTFASVSSIFSSILPETAVTINDFRK